MIDRPSAPAYLVWKQQSSRALHTGFAAGLLLHLALFLLFPPLETAPRRTLPHIPPITRWVELQPEIRILEDPPEVAVPTLPGPVARITDDPVPDLPGPTDHPWVGPEGPKPPEPRWRPGTPRLPEILHRVEPAYPGLAREAGAEGDVFVEVTVGTTGRVLSARVLDADTVASLRKAALEAARQWIFRAARQDGHPVEVRVVIPFRFRLD